MRLRIALAAAAALLAACAGAGSAPEAPPAPDLDAWRAHLLPTDEELAFEAVPWLPSFREGVLAGDEQQKPVLLWAMNGHPLGCT